MYPNSFPACTVGKSLKNRNSSSRAGAVALNAPSALWSYFISNLSEAGPQTLVISLPVNLRPRSHTACLNISLKEHMEKPRRREQTGGPRAAVQTALHRAAQLGSRGTGDREQSGVPSLHMMLHTVGSPGHPPASYPG